MKKLKLVVGVVSFTLAAAVNAAELYNYDLTGTLVSYAFSYGGGAPEIEVLDPAQPAVTGKATFILDSTSYFDTTLDPQYHIARLGSGGGLGTATYAGLEQKVGGFTSTGLVYDPVTGHLTGTGSAKTTWGIGSFCNAQLVAICSALYSEYGNPPDGSNTIFDVTFGSSLTSLNGTLIVNSHLNTGGWLTRTYSISGVSVPLPMSGMLFGSAALALAGMRRRVA